MPRQGREQAGFAGRRRPGPDAGAPWKQAPLGSRRPLDAGAPWTQAPQRQLDHLRFGHCRVTKQWTEDTAFGHWVDNQRLWKRLGKLSPERIARLEALGIEWRG